MVPSVFTPLDAMMVAEKKRKRKENSQTKQKTYLRWETLSSVFGMQLNLKGKEQLGLHEHTSVSELCSKLLSSTFSRSV